MARLTLEGRTLTICEDGQPPKTISLHLDALRLVFLLVPAGHSLANEGAERSVVDLDALSHDDLTSLLARLAPADGSRLFLEDYMGRYVSVSLQDAAESGVDLLAELATHRRTRRDKLADWSRNAPGLIITGAQGDHVTLNLDGVRAGVHGFVSWADLHHVDVTGGASERLSTYRFVPIRGRAKAFSVRMPRGKATLFAAEFAFWRELARRQAESPWGRAGVAPAGMAPRPA